MAVNGGQIDIVANLLMKVDNAEAGINKLKNSLSKLKMPEGLENSFKKSFSNLDTIFAKYKSQVEKGFNTKGDVTAFNKTSRALDAELTRISKHFTELTGKEINFKVNNSNIIQTEKELERLYNEKERIAKTSLSFEIKGGDNGLKSIETLLNKLQEFAGKTKTGEYAKNALTFLKAGDIQSAVIQLDKASASFKRLKQEKQDVFKDTGFDMGTAIAKIIAELTGAEGKFKDVNAKITETKNNLANLQAEQVQKAGNYAEELSSKMENSASIIRQADGAMQDFARSSQSMSQQLGDLQQSTQYFFSLRNMINLFKRGIDDAVQSVKELDAAMTETAVVTDYKVADLWGMLPQYTQIANQLGATTQGAYETMTLYFQQGLETQQAFEIGAETMKMARIAGLDYAETTDMMTAALRGFNMELNETSAQRINDIYSKLAAITASDTEELGTAMQRTASIAHSAGMSFEGTTAFLAQAIETTREPAENLGTAMKTIVARFQEMKENPLEIVEVDGEEVSYNKVDKALQSIGVSLKDDNGQFRELDKVFLDISQRWDSLTQTQQRYIATIAAGSRQQSRFIAMMSNYDRTVQLMSAANDSAGASQEQFNKTMDSLEAKLNKLHNAWQLFTMGIANNGMIKGAVDGITYLLNGVNSLINTLSLGSGALKSFLSLFAAFTGLKAGGKIINALIGGLGGILDPQSSFFQGLRGGAVKNTNANAQAQAISNPIVQAIHQLQAALTKQPVGQNQEKKVSGTWQDFREANTGLHSLLKGTNAGEALSLSSIYGKIGKLDDKQQASILQQLPGLQLSLQRKGIQFNSKDISRSSSDLITAFNKEINSGLKNKNISGQAALQMFGTPDNFKTAMKAKGPEYVKAANEIFTQAKRSYFQNQADNIELTQGFTPEAALELAKKQFRNKSAEERSQIIKNIESKALEEAFTIELSKGEKLANSIGNIGTVAMQAGQGIAQLGMQLTNAGFDKAGAMVTNLGYQISSLGQIAASAGSVIGKVMNAGGPLKLLSAHPYIAAAGIAITAITTVITAVKMYESHLKNAAKEVIDTYDEAVKAADEKISGLTSAKDTFAELASGVDKYGNNVSLTTEEYEQYLQTAQEVSQLAPELIRGYDAQGRAIVATGSAIDELIAKEEELKKAATETYVSDSSINALIDGARVSDAFKKYGQKYQETMYVQLGSVRNALQAAGLSIDEDWGEITNQLFGKEISLYQPNKEDLRLIAEHYGDIYRLIESQNKELTDKQKSSLENVLTGINTGWKEMASESAPLTQAIMQYLSSEKLDAAGIGIGEEFTASFNKGLENLSLEAIINDWDSTKIKQKAREFSEDFKTMTQEGSEYANIMEKVTAEQEKYNNSIDDPNAIRNYENAVEEYANQLDILADRYDDGTAAGELFADSLRETANNIRNYAVEATVDLGQALNTLSDEFSSAREAKSRFDEAVKEGDYYTAAEGYKSIAETVLDEKNSAGNGSLAGWYGAQEILGEDFVNTHSWDEIVKQVEKVSGAFEDGLPGVQKFGDLLVENAEKLEAEGFGALNENGQFEFNFENLEDLERPAELLGMSADALAALIDKSRQFVPWDLSDPGQVRKALEQSSTSMAGTSTRGESILYTSEKAFKDEAHRQGIWGDDYTKTRESASKEGVRLLTVENLTAKHTGDKLYADQVLENMGLKGADKNVENSTAALMKTGLDLEEIKSVLTSDGIQLANGPATEEQVETAYKEQEFAVENPTVAGIANDTGIIASAATAMLTSMGILTDQAKTDIEASTNEKYTQGLVNNLNQDFTSAKNRNEAVQSIDDQIAEYDRTLSLLSQGGITEGEYVDKLVEAKQKLLDAKEEEQTAWDTKINEAKGLVENRGKNSVEQEYLNSNAIDIQNILNEGDLAKAASQLREIEDAGNLSHGTMVQLAADFLQLKQNDLTSLNTEELDNLCTKLGLTQTEATELLDILHIPFSLEGRLSGEDLVAYINELGELSKQEKVILLRADLSGEEKVSAFIDQIDSEFGDGTSKTKSIILQAEAKLAGGDQSGAKKLLLDAGFNEDQAKAITQKLSITVDGTIANKQDVQDALNSQLANLDLSADVKARVNAKLNIDKQTANLNQTGTIKYKSEVDSGAIKQAKSTAEEGAIMPITASDKASSTIQNIRTKAGKPISFDVSPNFTGTWTKTLTIETNKKARGQNYSIPAHQSLSFGSAASGMNIPKKKKSSAPQMTALVGEEGFEVGYIPSEGRSVIFGANGPEMTSFPKDTIIYPHDESKKIIRRGKGGIPTYGSFWGGNTASSGGIPTSSSGSTQQTKKTTKKTKDKGVKKKGTTTTTTNTTINNFSMQEVYRFNIDKRIEQLTDKIKKATDSINKNLSKIGVRASDMQKSTQAQIKNLQQLKKYNQDLTKSYQTQINSILSKGYTQKLSYDEGGKKSKEEPVNIAQYIKRNSKTGTYEADYNKISKAGSNARREAIFKAVESLLNTFNSGILKSKQAAEDADKQIKDLQEQMSEAFDQWKSELTEVYDLTQRINNATSMQDRFASEIEFQFTRLGVGFGNATDAIRTVNQVMNRSNSILKEQIQDQTQMIDARKRELDAALSYEDELEDLNKAYKSKNANPATIDYLKGELTAAKMASSYIKTGSLRTNADGSVQYEIDWEKFNKDRDANPMNKETYEKIYNKLESLNSTAVEYNNSIKDQRDTLIDTYNKLGEYQDLIVEAENTLIQGFEEQTKRELDSNKKLSETVSNGLKDLLDEVKRKLDERRKAEDNQKTERDISQKQQRLDMLRADTAGGHALEIAQLEKEIGDAQQSYQRTLEDQMLERMQQQNDQAAKQRERQIQLAEAQLEVLKSNNTKEVNDMMIELGQILSVSPNELDEDRLNSLKEKFKEAYLEANNYNDQGVAGKQAMEQDFEKWFAQLGVALTQTGYDTSGFDTANEKLGTIIELIKKLENLEVKSKNGEREANKGVTETNVNGDKVNEKPKTLKQQRKEGLTSQAAYAAGARYPQLKKAGYTLQEIKNAGYGANYLAGKEKVADLSKVFTRKELEATGKYAKKTLDIVYGKSTSTTPAKQVSYGTIAKLPDNFGKKSGAAKIKAFEQSYNKLVAKKLVSGKKIDEDGQWGNGDISAIKAIQKKLGMKQTGVWSADLKKKFRANASLRAYASGGLASYTGPAWLDGTPSKPELVLNPTDTKNFIALRDILSQAMKRIDSANVQGGAANYEININVEKLSNDYDVDRVAARVKKIITQDSGYRNVNTVRKFR